MARTLEQTNEAARKGVRGLLAVIPGRRQWVRAKRGPMTSNPESRDDQREIPGSR
jgi:hypothetical protein